MASETLYAIRNRPLLIADGGGTERRWEDFDESMVPDYFRKSYETFIRRLHCFKIARRRPTREEEKELSFMMEALIHAKRVLAEKD